MYVPSARSHRSSSSRRHVSHGRSSTPPTVFEYTSDLALTKAKERYHREAKYISYRSLTWGSIPTTRTSPIVIMNTHCFGVALATFAWPITPSLKHDYSTKATTLLNMNDYLPSSRSDYGKHNYGYLLFAPAIHQDPPKKNTCMYDTS